MVKLHKMSFCYLFFKFLFLVMTLRHSIYFLLFKLSSYISSFFLSSQMFLSYFDFCVYLSFLSFLSSPGYLLDFSMIFFRLLKTFSQLTSVSLYYYFSFLFLSFIFLFLFFFFWPCLRDFNISYSRVSLFQLFLIFSFRLIFRYIPIFFFLSLSCSCFLKSSFFFSFNILLYLSFSL